MTDVPLPDGDHVSRYCKPSAVDEGGLPLTAAFLPKQGEEYLSVNWLEYFRAQDLTAAADQVRQVFRNKNYRLRPKGRFAVLEVGVAKTAVHEATGKNLRVSHLPVSDDESHSGIIGYNADDLAVAVELKVLVTSSDVHPAII